jgi:16S rRNA (guanine527-N7)-methyltransferase
MSAIQVEPRLLRYLDELYRWNQRINLTSIPREEAESRHLAEARRLLVHAAPAPGARVVDIGAGGGVPGLVMAILRPDLRVTLIESDRRKAGFLLQAAAVLAVSRATASAPVLCELALPLLHAGGRLVVLVADAEADAGIAAAAASACGGGVPAALAPGILSITKVAPTPELYPRRAGMPARRPLHGS